MGDRVWILTQDAHQPVVELGPIAEQVDPVGGAGEGDVRIRVGLLDGQVPDFHELSELLVRAEPGEAPARAGVARVKFRLVPEHPVVDLAGVVASRLRDKAAPVVVRIVERQIQVLGR